MLRERKRERWERGRRDSGSVGTDSEFLLGEEAIQFFKRYELELLQCRFPMKE